MENQKLPTIADIRNTDLQLTQETDLFNALMSENPPATWVKTHPFINNWKYIPIDKVEYLLKKIFKEFKIEITNEGVAFNGVFVRVRVHYLHPITNSWSYHDGIGACQLQTKAGTSPADLLNINNGALSMAFPIAETFAIKDACDKFGNLFGANLNRKDVAQFKADKLMTPEEIINAKESKRIVNFINKSKTIDELEQVEEHLQDEEQLDLFKEKKKELNKK